jgi:hypothetical protein
MSHYPKTPFVWPGGKSDAAPAVWAALGDVDHYVEPFAGSLAVLMRRPHPPNRTYHSETVNDLDGLLVNAWRSIQMSPEATAEAASWPVSEADMHARHCALLRWREERQLEHLMGDPDFHDPKMGGWWVWGQSSWIGSGWCAGTGSWWPDEEGRLVKREAGVWRKRPHLTGNGRGVNHANLREPGVERKRPHLSDDGMGVNHPGTREPGVHRKLPHLSDDGRGVNTAGVREPGVARQLPHLGNDGRGVNTAGVREPGVDRKRPHLGDDGMGVNTAGVREPGVCEDAEAPEWHPMTMPKLRSWMGYLSARLRHVRILNGDWKRACTTGAMWTLPVRQGGVAGVFLDPPYSAAAGRSAVYSCEDFDVAHACRAWALEAGRSPKTRIVLAGFEGEGHEELEAHGWRVVEWYRAGFLKGGYGNQGADGHQQARERLWLSPHCLAPEDDRQLGLL